MNRKLMKHMTFEGCTFAPFGRDGTVTYERMKWVVVGCNLDLKAKGVSFWECTFVNCTFKCECQFHGCTFVDCTFEFGCTFYGNYQIRCLGYDTRSQNVLVGCVCIGQHTFNSDVILENCNFTVKPSLHAVAVRTLGDSVPIVTVVKSCTVNGEPYVCC